MGGSSCSHSSSSSCVDASEEEDDQDGILPNVANLFEDEEAQDYEKKQYLSNKNSNDEVMEEGSFTHRSCCNTSSRCDDEKLNEFIEMVEQDNTENNDALSEKEQLARKIKFYKLDYSKSKAEECR